MKARGFQDWVRWWDAGPGRRWAVRAAVLLGVLFLSLVICFKQFHGARDEDTLAQLAAARGWASGRGHATQVIYPQAAALVESRGGNALADAWTPELYQEPGYAFLVGGLLRILPEGWRSQLLSRVEPAPGGFWGDYAVLALNCMMLLAAALLARGLGASLGGERVGNWTAGLLLLSTAPWTSAIALSGIALPMLLLLVACTAAWRWETAPEESRTRLAWVVVLGGGLGALCLVDYGWILAFPAVLGWLALAGRGRGRIVALAAFAAAWAILVVPWLIRNANLAGTPFGLAGQELFLNAGDPVASPQAVKATWSAKGVNWDWNKAGNRVLTHLRDVGTSRYWAAGFLASALAAVGLAYGFRDLRVARIRSLVWVLVMAGVLGEGIVDAGEGARSAVIATAPLVCVTGALFFNVLVQSRSSWASRGGWVTAGLLFVQALPLWHDLLEPRRIHFSYPPYYPVLIQALGKEVASRGGGGWTWMSDLPAGSAWYAGRTVVAKPRSSDDFRAIAQRKPVLCLLLSPETLDRPYFTDLAEGESELHGRSWRWAEVYRGLVVGRMPPGFPLIREERLAPNLVVLADPNSPPPKTGGR
ncbi:MAG: hypothetical protein SFV32_11290 [Opitutaceae bacterium]|nr:hypothetical protein [Opitutaceae bacterium]